MSQSTVFIINTIWTAEANDFLQSVVPEARDCILHLLQRHELRRSVQRRTYCHSWRSCCGQPFTFILCASLKASAYVTQNSLAFNIFVKHAATPSVHVCLHNRHVPIRFPLNHSPSKGLNPSSSLHNEGKTHKIKPPWAKTRQLPNLIKQCVCLLSWPWPFAWE